MDVAYTAVMPNPENHKPLLLSPGRGLDLLRILGALAVLAIAAYVGSRSLGGADPAVAPADSGSGVIVGTPGGAVIADPALSTTPDPTPTQEPPAAATPTPPPSPEPTAEPVASEGPAIAATPAPAPTRTAAPVQPNPTAAVVAVAGPADVVAAFYAAAVDGRFDAAYSHWSERMKANFPRPENLDARFDSTAQITFHQLNVAEMSGSAATVQANFTETYDSGATRTFVGFWRLVQVEGRWLLDEPHY